MVTRLSCGGVNHTGCEVETREGIIDKRDMDAARGNRVTGTHCTLYPLDMHTCAHAQTPTAWVCLHDKICLVYLLCELKQVEHLTTTLS